MADLADLMISLQADPSGIEEGMSNGKKLAAAGGAAIAAAIGTAAAAAMDISAANDKLAAQLGLSAAESERVGGVAGSLYANAYGENIEDVNTAVGAVMSSIKGMAAASSADLQSVTTKALDFATAFDVDVQRAVDVAGRAVSSGLASNATEAFDLITAASQKVPANLREDVLDATDEYGQFFASIGLDGPNAFGIMVDAASKGMFGIDKVGDAVKEFTILSTDGSKSTSDAFKSMGLNASEMTNSMLAGGKSAASATQQIVSGLLGIKDPGQQAQTALALFGTPLEDLNVKDIPEFLKTMQAGSDSLGDFEGAAARMGATLNDNASTNLTAFKRQAEMAFVKVVGGAVIPVAEKAATFLAYTLGPAITAVGGFLAQTLVPALKSSAAFIQANEKPILIVAAVIGAALLPALAVLAVQSTITAAKAVASWVAQQAAAVAGAARTVASLTLVAAQWVMSAARSMASAAVMAAAWLVSIGPIALVIAAVVGLVVVIVKNWETIKNAVAAAATWIWDKIKSVFGFIVDVIQTYLNTWKTIITTAWNTIKNVIGAAAGWIVDRLKGAWNGITSGVSAVKNFIVDKFTAVVDFFKGIPGKIAAATRGAFDGIKDAFRDAINFIIRGWNNLEFSFPGVSIPGLPDIPGFTVGVPDVPLLAQGGTITGSGLAVVGDAGPEVLALSRGAQVTPLSDAAGGGGDIGDVYLTVEIGGETIDAKVKSVVRARDRATYNAVRAGALRTT